MSMFAANTSAPLAEGTADNNGPPDIDFDLTVPKRVLGLIPATVVKVKLHTDGATLIVEFKLDHPAHPNTVVSQWCNPNDAGELRKMAQTIHALGVETVEADGKLKPECGWRGLVGLQAIVAVDDFRDKICIPRFGKITHADCPPECKGKDYGCGVMPMEGA